MSSGFLTEINDIGLLSARPAAAAANEGYQYHATDDGVTYRSNGSTWDDVSINIDGHADIDHTGLTGVGGSGVPSGTSFPGSPSNNDIFYRTDRDLLYFFDGTRWLSVNLYRAGQAVQVASFTTSPTILFRSGIWHTTYDLWLEAFYAGMFVATTNTGAAFWTIAFKKYQSDFSTSSTIVSVDSSANSPSVLVTSTSAIGALLTPATYKMLQPEATKTGSPGALSVSAEYTYRLVG